MSVELRRMRREDIPDGLRLCRAAGWNQLQQDWEVFLSANPDGCRVAVADSERVVGSVATIRYGRAFSWIAMVLVDPAYRGAGIGSRLLREAVTLLDDMKSIRLDATPAGQNVYAPFGFREEYALQRMQCDACTVELRPDPRLRRITDRDMDAIARRDLEVFGADRRVLLETFRRHAPHYAWVFGDDHIDGYVFGRPGHTFEHVGPLVAVDQVTAHCLISACLSACGQRPFVIDVPLRDGWISSLESMHFTVQRPFTRMCHGELPSASNESQIFAIAGPEFG